VDREELAWAAGFLDGEGHFGRHRRKGARPGGRLAIQVAQQDRRPLDRLQAILGGRVYGPYGPYGQTQPYFLWYIQGFERTQATIAMLWPFLSEPKRLQARRALNGYRPNNLEEALQGFRL
jgi:hypothetical protein